jgi:hypothetical protein
MEIDGCCHASCGLAVSAVSRGFDKSITDLEVRKRFWRDVHASWLKDLAVGAGS